MQGYYCNTCEKQHKVMEVCKHPVISQRDLEDRIEKLEREVCYLYSEQDYCLSNHT